MSSVSSFPKFDSWKQFSNPHRSSNRPVFPPMPPKIHLSHPRSTSQAQSSSPLQQGQQKINKAVVPNQLVPPQLFQNPKLPKQVTRPTKEWPFWKTMLTVGAAALAAGVLIKVGSNYFAKPLDAGYKPDPKMCDADTGIFSEPSTTCNPLSKGCSFNPKDRIIKFGTVYDNSADPARNHYANLTNALDGQFAKKWGLKHEVTSDAKKFTEKQCFDPIDKKNVDCELYYAKVRPFVEDCEAYLKSPPKDGKERWRIVKDDDMLTLRDDISPYDLIDSVRVNQDGSPNDASLILPTDSHPWPRHYMPNHKVDPRNRPNTGLIIGRIDKKACQVYRKWWEARNSIPDRHNNECRTLGICPGQNFGLHEQQGIVKVTADHPCLFDRLVTVIPVRDSKRTHIPGINSVYGHDKYCFQKCVSGGAACNAPYLFPETSDNPDVYQIGDLWAQPNAVPTHGRKTPRMNGRCPSHADFAALPLEEVRLEVLKELCAQSSQKKACEEFFAKK